MMYINPNYSKNDTDSLQFELEENKKANDIAPLDTDGTSTKSKGANEKEKKAKAKAQIAIEHIDIIQDAFWNQRPWILSGNIGRPKP
jgi:tRNA(His) guanylyltransferase